MSKNWVWTLSQLRIVDFAIGESEWHNKWQKLIRGDSNLVSRAFSFSDRTHNIGKNPGNEVAGILKNNGRFKKNQEKTRGEGRRGRLFGTRDGTNICVIINIFHSKKFGLDWKNNKKKSGFNGTGTNAWPLLYRCSTQTKWDMKLQLLPSGKTMAL